MAKYLIHACRQRLWYVNEYLIPSMLKQGIRKKDIRVFTDIYDRGQLYATRQAFYTLEGVNGGTWHLQDDIIISSRFKEITEQQDNGLRCGFASRYDDGRPSGDVSARDMWYSFPCIRIPNKLISEFNTWLYKNSCYFTSYIQSKKHDDTLFREFMITQHPDMVVYNLAPNLVEHIDYLIGGSIVNEDRAEPVKSVYWDESALVDELQQWIKENE